MHSNYHLTICQNLYSITVLISGSSSLTPSLEGTLSDGFDSLGVYWFVLWKLTRVVCWFFLQSLSESMLLADLELDTVRSSFAYSVFWENSTFWDCIFVSCVILKICMRLDCLFIYLFIYFCRWILFQILMGHKRSQQSCLHGFPMFFLMAHLELQ